MSWETTWRLAHHAADQVKNRTGIIDLARARHNIFGCQLIGHHEQCQVANRLTRDLPAACELMQRFDIRARADDPVASLSGGNIQKVLLARVLSRDPRVIVVSQPTRGLDVGATEYVRAQLLERRGAGAAILLVSEDLDELLALSDRLVVMYEGRIVGEVAAADADLEHLGMLMAGRGRAA